jgi:integrase
MAKAIVLIAAVSGLRVSEILGLHWSDLDLVVKKITLNSTWHSGGIIGAGKTEASKEPAFLSDKVVQALLDWKRITPYGADSDWVFASLKLKGRTPVSGSQFVNDWLRPRFVEFGVIDADYRGRAGLHAFRDSLASWLITEEGFDPKTAQGVLRHANSNVTMNVYTHANEKACGMPSTGWILEWWVRQVGKNR